MESARARLWTQVLGGLAQARRFYPSYRGVPHNIQYSCTVAQAHLRFGYGYGLAFATVLRLLTLLIRDVTWLTGTIAFALHCANR